MFDIYSVTGKGGSTLRNNHAIRDELAAKGVTLIDTREGTKFEIEA